MDDALNRFRQAADEENCRRPLRRRYSSELRRQAIEYWQQRRGAEGVRTVAASLGVSVTTLQRWTRGSAGRPRLRPIAIVGPASSGERLPSVVIQIGPTACAEIGELIGELYAIERLVPGPFPGDAAAQELRQQLRTERSQPIPDRIWTWATEQVGLPRSDFGKAVRYLLERWTRLTRFVTNSRIPLDNNAAERALGGPVVGRKNHYGSRSLRGTHVAALFYTLCKTAKLVGIDPHAYLLHALYAALAKPGAITSPEDLLTSPPA